MHIKQTCEIGHIRCWRNEWTEVSCQKASAEVVFIIGVLNDSRTDPAGFRRRFVFMFKSGNKQVPNLKKAEEKKKKMEFLFSKNNT